MPIYMLNTHFVQYFISSYNNVGGLFNIEFPTLIIIPIDFKFISTYIGQRDPISTNNLANCKKCHFSIYCYIRNYFERSI